MILSLFTLEQVQIQQTQSLSIILVKNLQFGILYMVKLTLIILITLILLMKNLQKPLKQLINQ